MNCELCNQEVSTNIWIKPMDELRFYFVCHSCKSEQLEEHKKWRVFRQKILKRDNYTCRDCESDKYLQVHHVSRRKMAPGLIYVLDNCVTLCRTCHKRRHDDAQTWEKEIDYDAPQVLCNQCGQHFHYSEYRMCYYCHEDLI